MTFLAEGRADQLSGSSLAKAVAANRRWGVRLGWARVFEPIAIYHLGMTTRPSDAGFARGLAKWQAGRGGLSVDGILGPKTWRTMRRAGQPAQFTAPSLAGKQIVRPHGYAAVVRTFGNPQSNHSAWRRANIVKAYAPTGLVFTTVAGGPRRHVWVHRLLKPQFERTFQALSNAGVWSAIQPISGPFAYRNVRGGRRLSMHAFGIAIDLNPKLYPRGQARRFPPATVVHVMQQHGFHWGVFWRTPDPHHFQFATGA